MILAQTSEMVDGGLKLAEQGGILGVMLALVVLAIVVLYRMVIAKLLEAVIVITGGVKEITIANKETADSLSSMIDKLRTHLPDHKGN